MVVVLAAALAYKYHTATPEEQVGIERKLSEQWQRTESLRQYLPSFSCGGANQTATTESTEQYYTMSSSNTTTSIPYDEEHASLNNTVRLEWIDAMFGKDFCQEDVAVSSSSPRQGVGMANVPSYTAYTATISPQNDKVGMTLTNIPIGVFVKRVVQDSEAYLAGIQEGSILVSLNHTMGMLGEPTKQALERLWQYEGHFSNSHKVQQVMEMTLYKSGKLYSVVLLTGAPFGIEWASCGQFPVVQRSYSHAARAGVKRGSLVARINSISLKNMDHQVAASLIRLAVQQGEDIHLLLCFTPPASRTSGVEKNTTNNVNKRTAVSTTDGVEVRVHPLAYSVATLFSQASKQPPESARESGVAELAARVAIGTAVAPTGFVKQDSSFTIGQRVYPACPPLQSVVVTSWNPWSALAYCLAFQSTLYQNVVTTPLNASSAVLEISNYQPFLLPSVNLVCETSSQELMAKLLDQAEEHVAFRQCLYYLLRAYVATLEQEDRIDADVLEILQAAFWELTDRMQADTTCVVVPQMLKPMKTPRVVMNGHAETTSHDSEQLVCLTGMNGSQSATPVQSAVRKKSVFRVFRKKSKSSSPNSKTPKSNKLPTTTRSKSKSPSSPEPPRVPSTLSITPPISPLEAIPPENARLSKLFDNMSKFLQELDSVCATVERSLLKSISQKIADWALQPWSLSKHKALEAVTEGMREALTNNSENSPVVNPIECCEILTSVDPRECYILPSAHFPLLLSFHVTETETEKAATSPVFERERLYRTKVEVVSIRGAQKSPNRGFNPPSQAFFVQGAISGVVRESGRSTRTDAEASSHFWEKASVMTFDTRSSWGAPQTLSLRLSSVDLGEDGNEKLAHADESGTLHYSSEVGFCWVDLRPLWARIDPSKSIFATVMCHAQICSLDSIQSFDDHGDFCASVDTNPERFEIELRVTAEMLSFDKAESGFQSRKRMLLYKHDDDLRQELFAIEFIKTCDALLKASGLDLNLLTFRCIPVGARQGFIEWVPGSVPLSDICNPPDDVPLSRNVSSESQVENVQQNENTLSEVARAGLMKYHSLHRMETSSQSKSERGTVSNNPIQDFLRSMAYDPDDPYLIRKDVMDTYVKSCAGYCIVSYLLGVGDRHLDNLLLHQTGHFFHCDFSFILGEDPKKYLPMRITEDMVHGMGGKDSDNYAMFLSLTGAAFLALRRRENVRVVLSLVRLLVGNKELSIHNDPDEAVLLMRERLCLNMSDTEAISYMEDLIETSISSKLWKAVDAIHSLGKRF